MSELENVLRDWRRELCDEYCGICGYSCDCPHCPAARLGDYELELLEELIADYNWEHYIAPYKEMKGRVRSKGD